MFAALLVLTILQADAGNIWPAFSVAVCSILDLVVIILRIHLILYGRNKDEEKKR